MGWEWRKHWARLRGQSIYRRFLRHSQFWGEERREAYVLEALRRTLIRAWEGTAYYRQAFSQAGFDPRTDLKAPEDLARLPLLSKQQVRENQQALTDRRFLSGSAPAHTSGTTGQPLGMRLNAEFLALDAACVFRHWSWAGYRFRDRMAAIRSYVPEREKDPLWRYDRLQNTLYLSAYHLTPSNCEQYLERLLEFRPAFLRGYPSSVALLAEYARPLRERFRFVRGIFVSSETLTPGERETIEETFGRVLFNWYGMTEPAVVMTECEQHRGMHLNWEYGYAELVPSEELPPGEYRLVATGFHNPVMPFIRYDTGDVVRLEGKPGRCPCGRNLPLLDAVTGRKDEAIVTPDGRRLPSVNFYSVFRQYREVIRFQLVQYGLSELSAKIALRPGAPAEPLCAALRRELEARLGPAIRLEIELTERFVRNADGKTPPIVRKPGTRAIEERQQYAISSQRAWALERRGETVHKLDWNEADQAVVPEVAEALGRLASSWKAAAWYPEADSAELLEALAEYTGVRPAHILLTHGSDLAMELIATCLVAPHDKVLVVAPTYDNFRAVCEQRSASVQEFRYEGQGPFPAAELKERLRQACPRLVYLTNPNNPIGYRIEAAELEGIRQACQRQSAILAVDEAYYEFCGVTMAPAVEQGGSLLVLRTFSKAFGLAGLRLGYILASSELAATLARANNPKNVTSFAKAAALAALRNRAAMRAYVEQVGRSKQRLYEFFRRAGIRYYPSEANFVLFEHEGAAELVRYLEDRNILARERTRFFAGRGHVRLTVGGESSTQAVIEALAEYFERPAAEAVSAEQAAEGIR